MCPACLASVAMIAGSVASMGGLTALIAKARGKNTANKIKAQNLSEEKHS